MSDKTHAEIVAEMRYKAGAICPWQVNGGTCELCPLGHSPHGRDLGKYCSFHKLAHELDAAHRREVEELKKQVGKEEKMRKTLIGIKRLIKSVNEVTNDDASAILMNIDLALAFQTK